MPPRTTRAWAEISGLAIDSVSIWSRSDITVLEVFSKTATTSYTSAEYQDPASTKRRNAWHCMQTLSKWDYWTTGIFIDTSTWFKGSYNLMVHMRIKIYKCYVIEEVFSFNLIIWGKSSIACISIFYLGNQKYI